MSTPASRRVSRLPPDAQQRIADACDRFDKAWCVESNPRLEDYLYDGATADEQRELLSALLKVEFFHRRQAQESISLDEHLARFSDQADLVRDVFTTLTFPPAAPNATPSTGPSHPCTDPPT